MRAGHAKAACADRVDHSRLTELSDTTREVLRIRALTGLQIPRPVFPALGNAESGPSIPPRSFPAVVDRLPVDVSGKTSPVSWKTLGVRSNGPFRHTLARPELAKAGVMLGLASYCWAPRLGAGSSRVLDYTAQQRQQLLLTAQEVPAPPLRVRPPRRLRLPPPNREPFRPPLSELPGTCAPQGSSCCDPADDDCCDQANSGR